MSVCSWFPILPLCTRLVCRSALQEMHKCLVRLRSDMQANLKDASRPCWRCLPYASSAVAAARWRQPSQVHCDTRGIGSDGLLPMAATIARAVCTRASLWLPASCCSPAAAIAPRSDRGQHPALSDLQ
ncbi:hypothetical protein V8C86DRAFT_2878210, partial [Haematococcus lacustris]